MYAKCFPCLPGYFSGVGDLFSALVLAHFQPDAPSSTASRDKDCSPLARAASAALGKTHALLARTHVAAAELPAEERTETDEELDAREPMRRVRRMRGRELRLIQGQDVIRGTELVEERRLEAWAEFWEGP